MAREVCPACSTSAPATAECPVLGFWSLLPECFGDVLRLPRLRSHLRSSGSWIQGPGPAPVCLLTRALDITGCSW